MDPASSKAESPDRRFFRGLLVGVTLGALVAGGAGFYLHRKARAREIDCGLVSVVVAARDIAPGTTLTYEMLKQRALKPEDVGSSMIRSDNANRVVGARSLFPLKAEDALTWTGLSVGVAIEECRRACEWVEAVGGKKRGISEP